MKYWKLTLILVLLSQIRLAYGYNINGDAFNFVIEATDLHLERCYRPREMLRFWANKFALA